MIAAEELKKRILASTGKNGQQILRRVIVAGQQILFDKQTHQQAFASITKNPGRGVANLMLLLYDQSRPQGKAQPKAKPTGLIDAQVAKAPQVPGASNTASMPRGALIPAGAVLLANVAEFADKAGIKPMDEAEFASQLEEMSVVLMDRFDKGFRDKVSQKTGKMGGQDVSRETMPPTMPAGGLINSAGGA